MNEYNKRGSQPIRSVATSQDVPEPTTQRKSTTIIARKRRKRNRKSRIKRLISRLNTRRIVFLVAGACMTVVIVICIVKLVAGHSNTETEIKTSGTASEYDLKTYYFVYEGNDGEPVYINMDELTKAWASEAGFERRYALTDEERYEIAQVVTAEADGECFAGKMAICQCILQAAEDDDIRPTEVFTKYSYSKRRPEPSQDALDAVMQVFDFGTVVTKEPIKYFYNPELVESKFHESQTYVTKIGDHVFSARGSDQHGGSQLNQNSSGKNCGDAKGNKTRPHHSHAAAEIRGDPQGYPGNTAAGAQRWRQVQIRQDLRRLQTHGSSAQ